MIKEAQYQVLYTSHKTRRKKVWQDGLLKCFHEHNIPKGSLYAVRDDEVSYLETFVLPRALHKKSNFECSNYLIQIEELEEVTESTREKNSCVSPDESLSGDLPLPFLNKQFQPPWNRDSMEADSANSLETTVAHKSSGFHNIIQRFHPHHAAEFKFNSRKTKMTAQAVKKKSRKATKQPIRLYSRGVVLGYRRSRAQQYESCSLLKIEGVQTKEDARYYCGKRVAYIYRGNVAKTGHNYRVIWGKVRKPHGNSGVVQAKFKTNLPPQSFGKRVRVFMYPSNI